MAILVGFWGKGEEERGKKKPLPFNLYPKPNAELKMVNRAVLLPMGTPIKGIFRINRQQYKR
ncbi:hypothetical protein NSTC731_03971 [Nostoc sp. DSM 114167]|jgi:hypothetical protein